MKLLTQLRTMTAVLPLARRNRGDAARWLVRRPQLLAATIGTETAHLLSASVDVHLKTLGELKVAAMVNCEFCIDIASALATLAGVTEQQLRDLPRFRDSDAFDPTEKLVLELATAIASTPAIVGDDLRERVLARFSRTQYLELAAALAYENQRARLNQALGIRPAGFTDGAACALPERAPGLASA